MPSCIRPFRGGMLTAGPDEIRKIDAQSDERAQSSDNASGLADLGWNPVSPSNRRDPRKLAPAYPIWSGGRRLGDTLVPEPCHSQKSLTRAVLLAMGTRTMFVGRRARSRSARLRVRHGPCVGGSCDMATQLYNTVADIRHPHHRAHRRVGSANQK